jgi:hypothetical protein
VLGGAGSVAAKLLVGGARNGQSVPVRASKPEMDAWQIVSALRTRPRGYVPDDKYATVVGFLTGFDEAQSGGALAGFQEFVELKFGSHSSIVWWSLAPKIAPAVEDQPDEAKVSRLLDLLEEYLAVDSGCSRTTTHLPRVDGASAPQPRSAPLQPVTTACDGLS